MTEIDIITALAVLEDAIRHCIMTDNVNMAGVLETLGFLATAVIRPFERFKSLAPRDGEIERGSAARKRG